MGEQDDHIERMMRRYRPTGPPDDLRQMVLTSARDLPLAVCPSRWRVVALAAAGVVALLAAGLIRFGSAVGPILLTQERGF